ncbi:UNVERIFIED_CONTAM: hypothetical protein RMT77_010441 [Armadillidium vulgare]
MEKSQVSISKDDDCNKYDESTSLSDFIKSVHKSLRTNSQGKDDKEVNDLWLKHAQNTSILQHYSEAMYKLATEHWEKRDNTSRINWTYNSLREYFFGGLLSRKMEKEERRVAILDPNKTEELLEKVRDAKEKIGLIEKLKVLDVGSCYNPFSKYEDLDVTAIDLHPAKSDVYRCDFLNVKVVEGSGDSKKFSISRKKKENPSEVNISSQDLKCKRMKLYNEDNEICKEDIQITNSSLNNSCINVDKFCEESIPGVVDSENSTSEICTKEIKLDVSKRENDSLTEMANNNTEYISITELKESSFDVVIFSFFLEYIPTAKLRYDCCVKAYNLLKSNGILCIITPDSKHLTGNILFFKLWKVTLALIGFERVKYEKCSHFHAMIFRKALVPSTLKGHANQELAVLRSRQFFTKYPHLKWETLYDSVYIIQDLQIVKDDDK